MKHLLTGRDITEHNIASELAHARTALRIPDLVRLNTQLTTRDISQQLSPDYTLVYALHTLDEALATTQTISQRLHSFLSIAYPEHVRPLRAHSLHAFATALPEKPEALGRALSTSERDLINTLAHVLHATLALKEQSETSIEDMSRTHMPNVTTLLGAQLAARLLVEAGSLARLARISASTIQMLGARKAVLRSLSTGSKNPKHGILFNHPYVRKSTNPGKHARVLADKVAIAARVDYFKGKEIGTQLLKQLT